MGAESPIRAAQYVRMSTEHQKYSPANQSEANHLYAASRGMEIIRTYADEGISGLTFDRRDALKRLIEDVQSGNADFVAILVYDVSRWGRFQDPDESGYYEYVCKRAGINVHYCAEQFENDGGPFSAIVKAIKRAMAGEYSRELSVRTFTGQSRLVKLGFRLGGHPGFGLRRMVVDRDGIPRGQLQLGQWKIINGDHIVLVPGPADEIKTVRWIFSAYAKNRKSESEIAAILNERGTLNGFGRPWNRHAIKNILQNEKYIGNNVWGRTSSKLRSRAVATKQDNWLRVVAAFEPIVDQALFDAAQSLRRERYSIGGPARQFSDAEMLEHLRRLLSRHGRLSKSIIDNSPRAASAGAYEKRFGRLSRAYALIGYDIETVKSEATRRSSNDELLDTLRDLLRKHGKLSYTIINDSNEAASVPTYRNRFGSLSRAYELIGYAGPWGTSKKLNDVHS